MKIALIKSYSSKPWRSKETYNLIENSLKKNWEVFPISTSTQNVLINNLIRLKSDGRGRLFVFNIAEFLDDDSKEDFIPGILEMLKTPHLGSSAKAIQKGLDKGITKQILELHKIPTPKYFMCYGDESILLEQAKAIGFPLIVKPIKEGGHIGITEKSIVHDYESLEIAVEDVFDKYDQPALVEEFLTGSGMREFSVGILDGKTRQFAPIEIDYDSMNVGEKILSYEAAQQDLEKVKPVREKRVLKEINSLAERTFDAIGANDYSRIDIRMDHSGFYVLEINVMPGLGPKSFLPEAMKDQHGLGYGSLIRKLTEDSIKRQF